MGAKWKFSIVAAFFVAAVVGGILRAFVSPGSVSLLEREGVEVPVPAYSSSEGELSVSLAFSTFLGGPRWGTVREIAFDSVENIVVTGYGPEFLPANFPRAHVIGPAADENVPVAKFSPDGRLLWMTIIGGSGKDRGYGVVVGQNDEIYIAGRTSSVDFPTTDGAYDRSFNGGTPNPVHGASDAYVLKLSADGKKLLYSTFLGGSKNDGARGGLAVDARGFAYVVGNTESGDYLAGEPARVNHFLGGHSDAFVTKVSLDGRRVVYTRFLGSPNNASTEMAPGVQVDSQGRAYVHLHVGGAGAFTTPDAFSRRFSGGRSDMYFARLSANGKQLLYATYFGGSGDEWTEHRMALDKDGNAYVAGQTRSRDFPLINAHQRNLRGKADGYLVKFAPNGKPAFSTYVGGSGGESALGPAVDAAGNVYVAGITGSSDFETTANAYDKIFKGKSEAFLRIYEGNGRLLYSTFFGGSERDFARYVAIDPLGNPILTGETSSTDFPITPGAYKGSHAGGEDGFVAKFRLGPPSKRETLGRR